MICSGAHAADAMSQTALQAGLDAPKPKRWGFRFGMSANGSFHEISDPARQEYLQISTVPSYKLSDDWKLSYTLIHTKDLKGERDLTISDSALGASFAGRNLNPYLKLGGSLSSKIPLAKTVRENESMITTLAVTPRLSLDSSRTTLADLSLSYALSMRRAFHRFTTNSSGASNDQYRVTQIVSAGYTVTEAFSLSTEYSYSSRWTYAGNRFNIFGFEAGVGYQATQALSLDLAVGTTANTLKDDGVSSSIAAFDKNTSEASLGATYSF
jgi:hypothetical protein